MAEVEAEAEKAAAEERSAAETAARLHRLQAAGLEARPRSPLACLARHCHPCPAAARAVVHSWLSRAVLHTRSWGDLAKSQVTCWC